MKETFQTEFKKILSNFVGDGKKYKSNRELAKKADISPGVISLYTTGRTTKPDIEIMARLSIEFGYESTYLLNLFLSCKAPGDIGKISRYRAYRYRAHLAAITKCAGEQV